MKLLLIGPLNTEFSQASKMALSKGAKVTHAESVSQAVDFLRNGVPADIIMIDVNLNIKKLIDSLAQERIHISVTACGVEDNKELAVKAIQAGAKEYIPLPPDKELISAVLEAASHDDHKIVFHDPAMEKIIQLADRVAPSQASILITGESGTGKEVMSRYIHQNSKNPDANFISVNCAAIPENLLESELFGHEKGAFTGAVATRIGKFEQASGGTLLLDEISEMDVKLQAKLLRAIQEKEIERVGGTKPIPIQTRLIATSNRNLSEEIRKGTFREDLYFRLNVVNLTLPPLRERPEDITFLGRHFAEKYAKENNYSMKPLSKDAQKKLTSYHWPGNVRELENTIHRAVLLSLENEIEADAIHLQMESGNSKSLAGKTMAEVEKQLIFDTMDHCLGDSSDAAKILGISIRVLQDKLNEYGKTTHSPTTHQQRVG